MNVPNVGQPPGTFLERDSLKNSFMDPPSNLYVNRVMRHDGAVTRILR